MTSSDRIDLSPAQQHALAVLSGEPDCGDVAPCRFDVIHQDRHSMAALVQRTLSPAPRLEQDWFYVTATGGLVWWDACAYRHDFGAAQALEA